MASKTPDQYNTNAKVANPDGTAHQFFVQQWNLLLQFVKTTVADFADVISAIAAAKAVADEALAEAQAANADTGVAPGSYGDATHVGQFTVNAAGKLTAAANVLISGGGGGGPSPFWATAPTAPTSATFTLVKGGGTTAALTDVTRGVKASLTVPAVGDAAALAERSVPASTFVMTAMFVPNFLPHNFPQIGLYVKDSGTGRIHSFGFVPAVTTGTTVFPPTLAAIRWTALDTFSSSIDTKLLGGFGPFWLRLQVDAINISIFSSLDGETFDLAYRVAKGAWTATIDKCGVFFNANPTSTFSPFNTPQTALLMSFDLV